MSIDQILRTNEGRWQRGRFLWHVQLSESERATLREVVVAQLQTPSPDWGAALLLLGADYFRERPHEAKYGPLGAHVGVPQLETAIADRHRNAMDWGCRRRFGLHVLRSQRSGRRSFFATMFLQSGAGWSDVIEIARSANEDAAWSWLVDPDQAGQWLDAWAERNAQRPLSRKIEDDDLRAFLLDRLVRLAQTRAISAAPDGEAVVRRFARELDCAEPIASKLAALLGAPPPGDYRAPGWPKMFLRMISGRLPRLVLRMPQELAIPPAFEGVTLLVFAATGGEPPKQAPRYRVERRRAVLEEGEFLELPPRVENAIELWAFNRAAEGHILGRVYGVVRFPASEVAVFDAESGVLLDRPQIGQRVTLAPRPGLRFVSGPGEEVALRGETVARRLTATEEPIPFELEGSDRDRQPWSLDARWPPMELSVDGDEVPGLTVAGRPVFGALPRVRLLEGPAELEVELIGENIPARILRLELGVWRELPGDDLAGRYRIEDPLRRRRLACFYLAPEAAFHSSRVVVGNELRLELSACWGTGAPRLTCPALRLDTKTPAHLQPTGQGIFEVAVLAENMTERPAAIWQVPVWRRGADLVRNSIDHPIEQPDLPTLRLQGGALRVYGEPATEVLVSLVPPAPAHSLSLTVRIRKMGVQDVPLDGFPPELFDGPLTIEIHSGGEVVKLGPFVPVRLQRPEVRPTATAGELEIHAPSGTSPTHVELVRAWQPEAGATRAAVTPGSDGWLKFALPNESGPYIVGVMDGDSLLGQMREVWSGHQETAPSDALDPVARALWRHDRAALRDAIDLADAPVSGEQLQQLLATFDRFGARWFDLAPMLLRNVLGGARLAATIRRATGRANDNDARLLRVMEDADVPLLAVRYAALDELGELLADIEEVAAFEALAQLRLGVVRLAQLSFMKHSRYNRWPEEYHALNAQYERVEDCREWLTNRQIDDVFTRAPGEGTTESGERLHVQGLGEALRRVRAGLGEPLSAVIDRWLRSADLPQTIMNSTERFRPFNVGGYNILHLECTVRAVARQVHAFRSDSARPDDAFWNDAIVLFRAFPILFDFWLTRLSLRPGS